METVVTIPDEIYQKAEALAAALGLSRSDVYAAALAEYLKERREDRVTERLDEVYSENDSALDPAIRRSQAAALPVEQW